MKLAEQGFFWVGTEHKKMPYGTILAGQMYVQYLIPAQVRHPYPVCWCMAEPARCCITWGEATAQAGWAHYYRAGGISSVYLIDRPGHGRAPYHPDALGPIGAQPSYEMIVPDLLRSHRWAGTGQIGDPSVDQFMASQNAAPQDNP